jgi:hypothetical protein
MFILGKSLSKSFPEPGGQFQSNSVQIIRTRREFNFFSSLGQILFKKKGGGGVSKN